MKCHQACVQSQSPSFPADGNGSSQPFGQPPFGQSGGLTYAGVNWWPEKPASISTLLWGKFSYFDDSPNTFPRNIYHLYGGVEKKFNETGWLNLLAGYRYEDTASLVYYYTAGKTFHYQTNISLPLTSRLSLEFDLKGKDFKGSYMDDYFEIRSYFSFHYSPRWILTFLYDRSTDPQVMFFKEDKKNNR